jgi:DNA polymerase-3 subunit beta
MVSTDGHRLSKAEITVDGKGANATLLIPNKGILELRRLCEELHSEAKDAELEIAQNGPNAFFAAGDLRFSVKLVDAQFPPYGQVIPKNTEHRIVAPRAAVDDALKAVSVAASDRTGGVKVTMAHNVLRFQSESPESGDGFDEVAIEYSGPEVTIGLNAKYLRDILGAMHVDDVALEVGGELDPVLVKPATETNGDENYLAVVMPMRI